MAAHPDTTVDAARTAFRGSSCTRRPTKPWYAQLGELGLIKELEDVVTRFDWHSQVTIRFVDGDGGAAGSRSTRTVSVHSAYVRRLVAQDEAAGR